MKKWIALALLLVLGGVGSYVYLEIRAAGEEAERPYEVEEMSDAAIAAGLMSSELRKRLDAVAQLEKLPPEERRAALLGALDAPDAAARLTALTALGEGFGADGEVVSAVLSVAKDDPDPDVRGSAFALLAKSGDPRVLAVAAETILAVDAPFAVKLEAARTLDALTGRSTATALGAALDRAEEAADELGMEWDEWIGENAERLTWNPAKGRFE